MRTHAVENTPSVLKLRLRLFSERNYEVCAYAGTNDILMSKILDRISEPTTFGSFQVVVNSSAISLRRLVADLDMSLSLYIVGCTYPFCKNFVFSDALSFHPFRQSK